MRKPVIGIAPDFNPGADRDGGEGEATVFIRNRYVAAIEAAGGLPFILPVFSGRALGAALLDNLDGLLLTGSGPDIDPRRYGERKRFTFKVMSRERTDSEFALVAAA
ncbi:MAG: gamma-glutamyl-gamma-aminobutyrate hydrolase family protein, partial [Nitrospirae bacterium]|nr:gamma-glutamyl-gamma-aminobutyrate hydrolase family protein [Nitrospirota bacterium]